MKSHAQSSTIVKTEVRKSNSQNVIYGLENPTTLQKAIIKSMRDSSVTVACGRTGSGKSTAAVSESVRQLVEGSARKIYVVRPSISLLDQLPVTAHVEASLNKYLGVQKTTEYLDTGKIRGLTIDQCRHLTFKSCMVILEDGNLATKYELYSLMSRLGKGSRLVILNDLESMNPDTTHKASGIKKILDRFYNGDTGLTEREFNVVMVDLQDEELVRNPSLERILNLFN